MPAVADIPEWTQSVDPDRLKAWMDERGLTGGELADTRLLAGGTQNILLRFRRGDREFVLRRPPRHPRGNSNETIRREARLLAALTGTDVPHPALIAACDDEQVIGASFYLMAPVDGFNPRGSLPEPHASDEAMRHRMGLALVEGIARLARLDHVALGLSDFGRPEGYLERQTERWSSQLASYGEHSGWPGPASLGDVLSIRDWLDRYRPASFQPGILHGDYHLSNVMYRPDCGELAAIVDWELSTIGAPMIDLGWLLATWPREDGHQEPGIVGTAPWKGFPGPEELVRHYGAVAGHAPDAVEWYAVLACFKLGIILEGTYARACAGKAPKETGDYLHSGAIALMARAREWMRVT